jgi:ketosteroid isomerase-like protein
MSDIDNVLAAHRTFYAAFEALDFTAMSGCWSQRDLDVCVHPGWEPLHGWADIRHSWRTIFANTEFMKIVIGDTRVEVQGDIARVSCIENIYSMADDRTVQGAVACTHVFVRLDGAWKLTLHHGSPIAATQASATSEIVN